MAKGRSLGRTTVKRLRELIAEIRTRYPSDDFFADFEESCRVETEKRRHYRCYNDVLMLLDHDSWNILKQKAIEHFMEEREGQRKQGFFNQLNEAFAYRHLLRKGFRNVRFIPEGAMQTPDISFLDGGKQSYCEVKTVGISVLEINRRTRQTAFDGAVYTNLNELFLNKLSAAVDRAWEQIHSVGRTGLVFILVRFDDFVLDHYRRYREQLSKFCRDKGFQHMVIKVGHQRNRRICA